MHPSEQFRSITKRIDVQESRIQQKDVQQLKEQHEQLCRRELEMGDQLSQEKARNRLQQLEIERRQQQLEESTTIIRKLQEELEEARKAARNASWELHENELKTKFETEITGLNARITGLEARLNRKQHELEMAHGLAKSCEKSARQEVNDLKAALRNKEEELCDLRVRRRLTEEESGQDREYLNKINQKIGSLEAQNLSFHGKVTTLHEENRDLTVKLKQTEEDRLSLQMQINTLKEQLNNSEGSNNRACSKLTDEIDRIKQQKAQLRCEHIQLKRKHADLETENATLKSRMKEMDDLESRMKELHDKLTSVEKEKEKVQTDNQLLIDRLKNSEEEFKQKLGEKDRTIRENEECESAQLKLLNAELDGQRKKCDELRSTVVELDAQCEKLMNKLRAMDLERRNSQSENTRLKKDMEELRKQFTEKFKMENELVTLRDRNKWQSDKIAYLERELREATIDHRKELANLTDTLIDPAGESSQSKKRESLGELQKAESRLRQQESEIRSLQRQLDQCKKEYSCAREEMEKQRTEMEKIAQENTVLRQNFNTCLTKAEAFKAELENSKEQNEQQKAEHEKEKNSSSDLLYELRAELEQKEKLVAYLQSVVQPKQMQKLPRHRPSLLSANGSDLSNIESEYKQCLQLEEQRNELKMNLENRRKILTEKQNEACPSTKGRDYQQPALRTPLSQPDTHSQLNHSSTESTLRTESTPVFPGVMRHDIPHRWKRHFITVATNPCQSCLDGLPYFRHVFRCRDCSLTVHPHCRSNVVNTCGLPTECANFYLDTHSLSLDQMTGWVKLWCLPGRALHPSTGGAGHWRNAWAIIDDHRLSFFESDQLAINEHAKPFMSIDLDQDHWRIYNQTAEKPVEGIRNEEMTMLIELKLSSCTLFMLAPTVQAKQRWVQALQHATSRRVFVQRRPSSAIVNNTLMLALDKPQDLAINCTVILREEWLLIGAQEGLFATSIVQQQLRAPFQIAGISKVYWMELLPEFDMLLSICGSARQLVVIHLQQLHRTFKAEQQPRVHMTNVANIEHCHIAVVSKPEHHRDRRYVYLATVDAIVILQYVVKLGVFSPVKQIKTEEPCMCICSSPAGFIFGSDNFHFAKFADEFCMPSPLLVDNCPFDFPVAAIEISDNEFLLAFHNFGLFVDSQGQRTRNRNIEWEKVPLEFVYTAPYLYIVYCEILEVVRIAPLVGPDSGTLTDDRNLFKCRSAHRTGSGLCPSDVLFAVSSENRIELHIFGCNESERQQQNVKSILKRKMNDAGHPNQNVIKRKY